MINRMKRPIKYPKKSLKRSIAMLLLIMLILPALPAGAQGAQGAPDTEPPVIEFLTEQTHKGLPVIYARDMRRASMTSAFYGFRVSDNLTQAFADRTFVEKPAQTGEGAYAIHYDWEALAGFAAPAAAEVRVIAADAAGNETAVQVWCVVRDMDAPYYAQHPTNPPNERENRLEIELADDDRILKYDDFITDRLVEQTEFTHLHIDTLPQYGSLLIAQDNAAELRLTKRELPYSLPLNDIRRGRVRYAPEGAPAATDGFLFRAQDALGNVALMQTHLTLRLSKGYKPPIITGIKEGDDRRNKNSGAFHFDIEITDPDTPAVMLEVTAKPQEGASRNAQLSVSYLSGDTWRIQVHPTQNMTGRCTYDITASDPEGNAAAAAYTLELVPENAPVQAMDDGVQSGESLHFDIDVLGNDLAFNGEALTIASVTQPNMGTVEIRGDSIYYAFNQGVQAGAPDHFSYTLLHDAKARKGERLTAHVYINDTTAPRIGEITLSNAAQAGWAEHADITVEIEEAAALKSVTVREIRRSANSLEEASDTVLALENTNGNTYTGRLTRSGQFLLDAVDVSGNRATRLFQAERINSAAPEIKLDWKQLINGSKNGEALLVEVGSAVAIVSAHVRHTSGGQSEGLRLEEAGRGVYSLYLGDESPKRLTLEFTDEMGHTASRNLGELRLDNTPPVIEVGNANDQNAYYLPRYVRIYDEGCGLAQVGGGLIMVENGLYRTWINDHLEARQHITAADRWGNRATLSLTMRQLPDPAAIEAGADLHALHQTIADIEGELKEITDPMLLTGAERGWLEDLLYVLRHQSELAALYQSIPEEGPDEAQTRAYLSLREAEAAMTQARQGMLSAPLSDALDEAFAVPAMAIIGAQAQDTLRALTEGVENEEIADEEFFTALEDTVMACMAFVGPDRQPDGMEELVELYDAMHAYRDMQMSTDDGFLLGMLSRVDYSPVPEEAGEKMLYLDTQPADQISAAPPEEGYYFVNAYDVSLRVRTDGEASDLLELQPGKQALLALRLDLDAQVYDLASAKLMRAQEGYSVEQEALYRSTPDGTAYLMTYASALGRFELYAKRIETRETLAPAPAPTPSPAPSPTPSPTPRPQSTPEETPAVTPPPGPTLAPQGEGAPPPVNIPSWPLYLVGGITLLIFLCWVVVTLRRR